MNLYCIFIYYLTYLLLALPAQTELSRVKHHIFIMLPDETCFTASFFKGGGFFFPNKGLLKFLNNQSFVPYIISVQDVKSSTRFPHSVLGTLLVNLQMLSCFSVQCWIYPQKSVYVNHTLVVNYVGLKACITFLSATSLCIGLSIDLAIKTLLVLLSSVAPFQFHVLPGSPIMIVSPAAPAWPLRAFTL